MKQTKIWASALAGALVATMMSTSALASTPNDAPSLGGDGSDRPSLGGDGPEASAPSSSGSETAAADDPKPKVAKGDGTTSTTYAAKPEAVKSIKLDDAQVNIVGASWKGDDPELEIRHRDGGGWSSWQALPAEDGDGPDPQSAEDAQIKQTQGQSVAVPVVDSSQVEVRSAGSNQDTSDLTITKVATAVSGQDSALAKKSGSAVDPAQGLSPQVYQKELKANIVTRKEWGADEKLVRCETDKTTTSKGVFLHHTAGSNSYTKAQAPGIIRGYLAYHTQNRGWCDLGYNFLVDKYGTIYEGRAGSIDLAVTGAHASGFNSYTIGISVLGTYTSSAPSTAAQNSVKRIIAWKANQYGFNPTGKMTLTSGGGSTSRYPEGKKVSLNVVSGHRDTSYTECPGTSYYAKLGSIRSGAKSLQSTLGGHPVKGAIGTYYRAHSSKTGPATSVEKSLKNPNGAYQYFQNGTVYWSSPTGAHLNGGGIRTAYKAVGFEKGSLGFPTSDEKAFKYRKGAVYQNFTSGMIAWSSATKGQPLSHGMLTEWKKLGWERSKLGLPTSGEYAKSGKTRQDFEHGYMTYKKGEGVKVYVK